MHNAAFVPAPRLKDGLLLRAYYAMQSVVGVPVFVLALVLSVPFRRGSLKDRMISAAWVWLLPAMLILGFGLIVGVVASAVILLVLFRIGMRSALEAASRGAG